MRIGSLKLYVVILSFQASSSRRGVQNANMMFQKNVIAIFNYFLRHSNRLQIAIELDNIYTKLFKSVDL